MSFLSVALSYIYISTIFYNILLCQSSEGYGYIWQVKGYKILCHFINTADKWCLVDCQQFQMWFGTFTHTCTAPRGMVVGNCHLQGMLHSPWGRSLWVLSRLAQIQFFSGSRVKGPSSLALPRMVRHQWPVALVVIWHIYSCLACSSEDSARDLPSSGKVVLGQGQVPCEFWADRPNIIFQPVAPDMIWHIYLHLYCSSRDGGRDLSSSGEAAPTMGKDPYEFQADQPGFSFSGEELRQGSFQPCYAYDSASPMASVSGCDLHINSHLYCSSRDGGRDLLSSGEAAPTMGKVPSEFQADRPNFIFQPVAPDVIWHIYCGQHCFKVVLGMDLLSSGKRCPHDGAGPLWVLRRSANLYFSATGSWCDLAHLLWGGLKVWTCHL